MSGERLSALFADALELAPSEREAFVRAATEDREMRDELLSLCAAHEAAPDFLEGLADVLLPGAFRAFESPPVAPGTRVGPYEIVELVGAGGMGVVYRAHDAVLERPVALKFLPSDRAGMRAAWDRLAAEARAASALDHPNIAVVYQIGFMEGHAETRRPYLAMAFYEGETLAERIARGPVPPLTAARWAADMADALAEAHGAGVTHRDIKPANVMVTDRGQVKILDFGVASMRGGNEAEVERRGTISYMSPEQLRGDPAGHHADLWALGVVLFEMLAGRRPFRGQTPDEILAEVRGGVTLDLGNLAPDVPVSLATLIAVCLAPGLDDRWATASAIRDELLSILETLGERRPRSVRPDRPGILVLPFLNISADAENDYLSDGLTDEMITRLGGVGVLRVISRTSAMRLKGESRPLSQLVSQLSIRYVLEGSVRKAGRVFRVTTRLIDAETSALLWSHSEDGTVDDVFAAQEAIARGVVDTLAIDLSPVETRSVAARPIDDWRAYESFLRARYEAWRFTEEGLERAQHYIDTAIAIVGDNALLYSTLGHITAMSIESGINADPNALDRVDELATRVFALDPDAARGHWLRAFAAMNRGRIAAALDAAERSVSLAPDDPDSLVLLGYLCARVGRAVRAKALFRRAIEVDPLTPLTQCMPGFVDVLEGRATEAVAAYRTLHAMDPDSPFAVVTLGWVLAQAREDAEALAVLDEAAGRFHDTPFASWAASLSAGLRGETAAAREAIDPAFTGAAETSEMFARALAECLALAGDTEGALRWLARAVDLGLRHETYLTTHDRFLSTVRDEPGFRRLLQRVRSTD